MTSPSVWGVAKLIWGGAICYSYISNWWGSHRLCPRRLLWKWVPGMVMKEKGLPWWLSRKESASQWRRYRFDPWVWKTPWMRKWQPTPVLLPEKSHRRRSLVGSSPWGCKESDMTEWLYSLVGSQEWIPNSEWRGFSSINKKANPKIMLA